MPLAHAAKKRVTVVFKVFIAQGKIWGTTTRFLISVFFLVKKMCFGMYFIFRLNAPLPLPPFRLLHLPLISCPFLHSPLPTFPSPLLSFTLLPSPLLLSPLSLVLSPEPDACGTKRECKALEGVCNPAQHFSVSVRCDFAQKLRLFST